MKIYTLEEYLKAPKSRRENKWGWYQHPDGFLWNGEFNTPNEFDVGLTWPEAINTKIGGKLLLSLRFWKNRKTLFDSKPQIRYTHGKEYNS